MTFSDIFIHKQNTQGMHLGPQKAFFSVLLITITSKKNCVFFVTMKEGICLIPIFKSLKTLMPSKAKF